jgi:hypothetical protein
MSPELAAAERLPPNEAPLPMALGASRWHRRRRTAGYSPPWCAQSGVVGKKTACYATACRCPGLGVAAAGENLVHAPGAPRRQRRVLLLLFQLPRDDHVVRIVRPYQVAKATTAWISGSGRGGTSVAGAASRFSRSSRRVTFVSFEHVDVDVASAAAARGSPSGSGGTADCAATTFAIAVAFSSRNYSWRARAICSLIPAAL